MGLGGGTLSGPLLDRGKARACSLLRSGQDHQPSAKNDHQNDHQLPVTGGEIPARNGRFTTWRPGRD
jgi:hypothetical protein